jgi:hypothetical protein
MAVQNDINKNNITSDQMQGQRNNPATKSKSHNHRSAALKNKQNFNLTKLKQMRSGESERTQIRFDTVRQKPAEAKPTPIDEKFLNEMIFGQAFDFDNEAFGIKLEDGLDEGEKNQLRFSGDGIKGKVGKDFLGRLSGGSTVNHTGYTANGEEYDQIKQISKEDLLKFAEELEKEGSDTNKKFKQFIGFYQNTINKDDSAFKDAKGLNGQLKKLGDLSPKNVANELRGMAEKLGDGEALTANGVKKASSESNGQEGFKNVDKKFVHGLLHDSLFGFDAYSSKRLKASDFEPPFLPYGPNAKKHNLFKALANSEKNPFKNLFKDALKNFGPEPTGSLFHGNDMAVKQKETDSAIFKDRHKKQYTPQELRAFAANLEKLGSKTNDSFNTYLKDFKTLYFEAGDFKGIGNKSTPAFMKDVANAIRELADRFEKTGKMDYSFLG